MPDTPGQGLPPCVPLPTLPICLVVDRSRSMNRHRDEVLTAIARLERDVLAMDKPTVAIELAIVAFGLPEVLHGFRPIRNVGTTYLGSGATGEEGPAIDAALDLVEGYRAMSSGRGRVLYRPLLLIMTNGASGKGDTEPLERLYVAIHDRRVATLPLVPKGVDPRDLAHLSAREPLTIADASGAWLTTIGHYLRTPSPPRVRPIEKLLKMPPPWLFDQLVGRDAGSVDPN